MNVSAVSLSVPQILSLIGMVQCAYLLLYIGLRGRKTLSAGLPLLYFLVLFAAFAADMGAPRFDHGGDGYFILQWALWFLGPPLSVLLVIQLADSSRPPPLADMWVFLLLPLSYVLTTLAASTAAGCESGQPCEPLRDMLSVTGLMAGTISLLVTFSKKDLLRNITRQKQGQARYWLVFSLIVLNTLFLTVMLLNLMGYVADAQVMPLRNLLGLGFVYLASTSLLRLFPATAKTGAASEAEGLDPADRELATRIERLLDLDKVYPRPRMQRARGHALARHQRAFRQDLPPADQRTQDRGRQAPAGPDRRPGCENRRRGRV
jgi:hypothetical protein